MINRNDLQEISKASVVLRVLCNIACSGQLLNTAREGTLWCKKGSVLRGVFHGGIQTGWGHSRIFRRGDRGWELVQECCASRPPIPQAWQACAVPTSSSSAASWVTPAASCPSVHLHFALPFLRDRCVAMLLTREQNLWSCIKVIQAEPGCGRGAWDERALFAFLSSSVASAISLSFSSSSTLSFCARTSRPTSARMAAP